MDKLTTGVVGTFAKCILWEIKPASSQQLPLIFSSPEPKAHKVSL